MPPLEMAIAAQFTGAQRYKNLSPCTQVVQLPVMRTIKVHASIFLCTARMIGIKSPHIIGSLARVK